MAPCLTQTSFLVAVGLAIGCRTPGQVDLARTKARATVSVKDFGARGDGVANDSAAVRAAIAHIAAGGSLIFPAGTYRLENIRLENLSDVDISGPSATIKWLGSAEKGRNIGFELAGTCRNVRIHDLSIVGSGVAGDGDAAVWGFSGQTLRQIRVDHCRIRDVTIGISLNADLGGSIDGGEIAFNELENIVGSEPGHGYGIHVADGSGRPIHVRIVDNTITRAHRHAIYQARGSGTVIARNTIRDHRRGDEGGPSRSAIAIARSSNCTLTGNVVEGSVGEAIAIDQDDGTPPTPTHDIVVADNVVTNTNGVDLRVGNDEAREGNLPSHISVERNRFIHAAAPTQPSVLVNRSEQVALSGNRWTLPLTPPGYRVLVVKSEACGSTTCIVLNDNFVAGAAAGETPVRSSCPR